MKAAGAVKAAAGDGTPKAYHRAFPRKRQHGSKILTKTASATQYQRSRAVGGGPLQAEARRGHIPARFRWVVGKQDRSAEPARRTSDLPTTLDGSTTNASTC